jgi:hypothetical protein
MEQHVLDKGAFDYARYSRATKELTFSLLEKRRP